MKSSIIFLVLLSTYCYCEQILGGWSISNDDNLHRDCLNKALLHIHGDQINDEIRSQASDLTCKTQIVNGLNIKCTFTLRGQKWHCSYYKSFVQTLATQLEECKRVEIEQPVVEQKEDKPANEELETANEDDKVEEPVMSNEDDEEEQQVPANKDEKEKQVGQESLIADQNEEDDEAKIDAMNQQMAEQNANHEEEQQA
jgi:hypothetical protein